MDKSRDKDGDAKRRSGSERERMPPAGPHAKPELTDHEKTPGTGSLPDDAGTEGDVGPD